MRSVIRLLLVVGLSWSEFTALAQVAPPMDVSVYRQYFDAHTEMTADDLLSEFDAGAFAETAPSDFTSAAFASSIEDIFGLTADEIALIRRHSFVVSERMTYESFGHAFYDIFINDMPVYVSSDAILHAVHMSYDDILKEIEYHVLIPGIESVLSRMHGRLPDLASRYSSDSAMAQPLADVDLYLTVPRILLNRDAELVYPSNEEMLEAMLAGISAERPIEVPLFAGVPRQIDLSQFKPRGHYTDDIRLERYFRAMMWLGRIELYLDVPVGTLNPPTEADVQRQIVMTALISELVDLAGVGSDLHDIDLILRTLIGVSDNVTLPNVREVMAESGIGGADVLLDTNVVRTFQDVLSDKPYAFQKILSQILYADDGTEPIAAAPAFLLMGQRFIIDSYVTASLVYNQIWYQGKPMYRMMPSTLDILFALGNDGAAQFLKEELDRYHYARYLGSLRYLIDSYDHTFWSSSLYNGWLNAIRQLNPPRDREHLPAFMKTAAWWQKEMNTQLAAWAQLRHDNLLYAKPSYTGGVVCLFPESYVEPVPAFFLAVSHFASNARSQLDAALSSADPQFSRRITDYFRHLSSTTATLGLIAQKEITGEALTQTDRTFLGDMLHVMEEYAFKRVDGWYPKLFYHTENQFNDEPEFGGSGRIFDEDLVVADVHTQPTDEFGNMVGKVLHAGTGPANMAVLVATPPQGAPTVFIGPVMSYYEHTTLDFDRLTDEEWSTMYDRAPSFRPEFSKPYMADHEGAAIEGGSMLATGIEREPVDEPVGPKAYEIDAYPNPFKQDVVLRFSLGARAAPSPVIVQIFDSIGRLVTTLLEETLRPGHYTIRWDGRLRSGTVAPTGSYTIVVQAGRTRLAHMVTRVR